VRYAPTTFSFAKIHTRVRFELKFSLDEIHFCDFTRGAPEKIVDDFSTHPAFFS
jgi:hypothetical protein